MRFSIITHVPHKKHQDQWYAYGPYVKEMNIWAKYADVFEIVAPISSVPSTPIDLAYQKVSIDFQAVNSFSLLGLNNGLKAIVKLPKILYRIYKTMARADHIHLRCPGNMGLLGCIVQLFFPSKPKSAKYAGNWDPTAKQPWSYRLQKWILAHPFLTRNMEVLVYGEWPHQSKNVRSFFTASYSKEDQLPIPNRNYDGLQPTVFVGALTEGKRVLLVLKIVHALIAKGHPITLAIYGDGAKKERLQQYCQSNGLEKSITFKGNQSGEVVKKALQEAHFLWLPSKSEGWPKVVAEAMWWGCIPIATPISCVPWMLGYGERGILMEPTVNGGMIAYTKAIVQKKRSEQMSDQGSKWARSYTLEHFEEAVKAIVL